MTARVVWLDTERIRLYRRNAARLMRDIRARIPKGCNKYERRDWNLRAVIAAYNYIARMQRADCIMRKTK
jgi:hypothetical protein